jgi:hypothetical protein
MYALIRLVNLAVIVVAMIATARGADDPDSAYAAGRWSGAALLSLVPLLCVFALRPRASPRLRSTTLVITLVMLALFCLGAVASVIIGEGRAAVVGLAMLALLYGVDIWALRSIARLEDDAPENARGWFVARYWRGEFPLGVTFWVGGSLVLLLQFIQMGTFGMLADSMSLRVGAIVVLSMYAITLLLFSWQCVGVWRAATHRASERPTLWTPLARLCVITGAIAFAYVCVALLWLPAREHALIAIGRDPLPPLDARVTTNDTVLLLHGTFGAGSAERVRALLDETRSIRTVALSSPGGRLREASEIARMVRRRGLDTYVDTRCESACTFVFLAGKDRAATPNARIGFHRPSFAGLAPMGFDPATRGMLDTYRSAGIPKSFLDRVAATDPARMWYPEQRELEAAGVINRISLGGETSAIGFLAVGSRQELDAAFRTVPMMVALERHFPGTIDAAVRAAWMERTQGGIDSAVSNAARAVVGERYPRILMAANDESLDRFASIMLDQMKAASAISIEACRLLLAGQLNVAQVLSADLVQREQDWALGVLKAEKLEERPPVDAQRFRHTMDQTASTLPQGVLDVVGAPEKFRDQPERQCAATIALYDRIMELPADDRHLLLRGMFQAGSL